MSTTAKFGVALGSLLSAALLAGCVSQSSYDDLKAQNQQLQQQVNAQSAQITAQKAQIDRLVGAIKYTVNSDLLFPPGSWQLSGQGKRIIASFAQKLAPTQEHKLLVNGYTDNAPIGPALARRGVTTNQDLSQKRADSVMAYLISQGVKPDLVSAHGYGDSDPIVSNSTPQGRAQNRRVELTLSSS